MISITPGTLGETTGTMTMASKTSRSTLAVALSLGVLASFSDPSHAGLSTNNRVRAADAPLPAPEQPAATASGPAAPNVAAVAPEAEPPRKPIARPATRLRRFTPVPRFHHCH
jgi:hypothetical protein